MLLFGMGISDHKYAKLTKLINALHILSVAPYGKIKFAASFANGENGVCLLFLFIGLRLLDVYWLYIHS